MHSCKVGWAGQAFALATSSDAGGRKSRIRRSKEERKSMIESFIQKYQMSNDGSFPSLNLTHKEVGGSFYTVREIVREIIQENRVLAPPKESMEEHSLSEFLEQHPLGSISMDPLVDLSVDVVTHIVPEKNQHSSAVNISTSRGSYPLESNEEQTVSRGHQLADKDGGSDGTSESHHVPNHVQDETTEEVSNSPQSESHEFEENLVNGFEVVYGSPLSDISLITSDDHYVDMGSGAGSRTRSIDHQTIDEAKAEDTQGGVKFEAQKVETSPFMKSHTNSDVVVETFPLRPVPRTIHNMPEDSGELQGAAETMDDYTTHLDKKTFIQSSSSFASKKGDEKLPHSTVEPNGENGDEKPSLPELETLPDRAKASSCITVGGKSGDGESSKGNNPTMDRINLETWDGSAKKPESNPFLALVKAIISSFVKFWTE